MKKSLRMLCWIVVITTVLSAGVGVFYHRETPPQVVQTIHNEEVVTYGKGIYANDSAFKAPVLRGTDIASLFLLVLFALLTIALRKRTDLGFQLAHIGLLSYMLYYNASIAFGVMINPLFPIYIAGFSSSLFLLIALSIGIYNKMKKMTVTPLSYERWIIVYLILAGLSLFAWVAEIAVFILSGKVPASLAHYTTEITFVIDLGVIAPVVFTSAVLLKKKETIAYLTSSIMMSLNAAIAFVVIVQTLMQKADGIELTNLQLIFFMGTFAAIGAIAVVLNTRMCMDLTAQAHENNG